MSLYNSGGKPEEFRRSHSCEEDARHNREVQS